MIEGTEKMKAVMIQLLVGNEGKTIGPFPYVQITYDQIKVEYDDDLHHIAYYDGDYWIIREDFAKLYNIDSNINWSDVIIKGA